jgi:peptidyl-prolyl cis-trans isomerase SurA
MKTTVFAIISLIFITNSFAQNVFTYGNKSVTKAEFLEAFNKDPAKADNRKKALQEYLQLYINYKIKVEEAYAEKLDKDPTQVYELDNFKRQLADNVINEEANIKALIKEAFERSQKEIQLSQVFVEAPAGTDTTVAFQQIQKAYKALQEGKDFETVSQQFSSDSETKLSKGRIGFIGAFTLPYDLESIAYSLKPNAFSAPIKTKLGYHIFKNTGERKSQGSRRVAQILIPFAADASAIDKAAAARITDSVYTKLQQGTTFETLGAGIATTTGKQNPTELPEFTAGTYSPDFENVAFSLTRPNEYSKPFQTAVGFHILKLIAANPAPNNIDDAATFSSLQLQVMKDNRLEWSKKKLIDRKLTIIKYKPGLLTEKKLLLFTDSVIHKANIPAAKNINEKTVIFSFEKQHLTVGDWIKFARIAPQLPNYLAGQSLASLYTEYIREVADEYYRNHLEQYNRDYAKQVKEFKDANLLFAIMQKKVWNTTNTDTAGLVAYYNQHKSKYLWEASADAVVITCSSKQLADEMQQKVTAQPEQWKLITENAGADVSADSGRFELGQLPVIDRTNFTAGLITAPVKNETESTYTFNYVIRVYNQPSQRSFEDAQSMVITDYQQVIESKWIAELRKKYPVKINEPVFRSIQ